jgi:hypothetical protein
VADLINAAEGTWNESLVRDTFIPDANAILFIPLGGIESDTLAWAFEKHGMYTLRLTYHLLSNAAMERRLPLQVMTFLCGNNAGN